MNNCYTFCRPALIAANPYNFSRHGSLTKTLALACACLMGIAAPASALDIAWVSFHAADNMPSADAATDGFTEAPDKGYTDLLMNAGHDVTRIVGSAAPDVSQLNTFDLVMISRSNNSGNFQTAASSAAWSSIEAPTIHLGGYAIRGGTGGGARLGFTTGETIPDTTGPVNLTINNTSHPIFTGVARDAGNVMVDVYADLVPMPFAPNTVQRGISVNTNALTSGGTLLASLPSMTTADPPGQVGMVIGEFPAGTTMSNGSMDVQQGHRLVFLTGSREQDITSQGAGIYDLSATGATMLLNAVNYMGGLGPVLTGDVTGNGVVDINDYVIIRNNFNMTGKTPEQGDVNFDTVVNFADFRLWKNNRTAGAGAGLNLEAELAALVPEPGSLALALLGALALLSGARRRVG